MKGLILVPILLASMTGIVFAATPFKVVKTEKGVVLSGEKGRTLYTFKKDEAGTSNCYDECAQNWLPAIAAASAKGHGAYSILTRKDGTKQWAKDGKPLYYWSKDAKQGDVTGDGVGGVWDAAKP
ncbi:COG4315 family predicted lipoprotein [Rhizobium grahamii]|uniref:Lipoprotein n=1 Tax=Rhizobium grahamii CCGE 502 TaxID=990285 RepID=S3HJS7_9HYPH|nr:lipoprotein [Rhizobium grahamii]EPE93786.1 lipoprotein [Rhizobium grahamii CCGE 502]